MGEERVGEGGSKRVRRREVGGLEQSPPRGGGGGRGQTPPHPPPPPPPPLGPLGTSLTLLGHRLTKTSNIQHTNEGGRTFKWEALIDLGDNMIKQFGVKRFAQCISCSTGLFWLQWHPVKRQQKRNPHLSPSSNHIRMRSLKYLTLLLLRD